MKKSNDMNSDVLQQTQQPNGPARTLTPTMRLRWQKRVVAVEVEPNVRLGRQESTLQQCWVDSLTGEEVWRDVETVVEELK